MSSELEILRQRITELEAKYIEAIDENEKLRRALEEHDARFTNLEQRDKEKTSLIAKLDDDIKEIKEIKQSSPMEDKETNDFLDKMYKKSVSDRIRQMNREKKEAEDIVKDVFDFTATSASEKNHATEILLTPVSENHVTENSDKKNSITILSVSKSKILLNLASLYRKACDAENQTRKANQDEILCWYCYIVEFDNQVKNIMKSDRIGEKKAKGKIYDFITTHLGTKRNTLQKQTQRARKIHELFEKIGIDKIKYITTYSANSISELSDSQIQTIIDYFSENPNTELPDGVPLGPDQEGSIIDSEEEISDDRTNASTISEVSVPTTPIPSTHVSNSSSETNPGNISITEVSNPLKAEDDLPKSQVSIPSTSSIGNSNGSRLPISILPEDPEEKRKHIIGLVLERFPYLSLEYSESYGDRFVFNSSVPCPMCNKDHEGENLKGEWGSGMSIGERAYYLECLAVYAMDGTQLIHDMDVKRPLPEGDKLMIDPELKEKLDEVNEERDRRTKEKPPVEKSDSDNSNGSD
ncbi:hypothetical protein C1646_771985 [Rhizophagus diaphanus]|nr:hypothetical protein C1646_771985 [Rhizophagus diaphanus] [Rhizophagus sp. MUCL 43196]